MFKSQGAQIWLAAHKRHLQIFAVLAVIALLLLVWMILHPPVSPVPTSIKSQANFSIIYPRGYSINPSSWKYVNSSQSAQFIAKKNNFSVVFNEQKVPLAYQNDQAAYNRFIGSLRPSANFNVPLGAVSITSFVTAGDYQPEGSSGILNSHGTLVIAHPSIGFSANVSDGQWRDLFNSLKIND